MDSETLRLEADDGQTLVVHSWVPEASPRATIQIAHGLAEHGLRYARLAEALVAEGYAVYANDHRGHGETAGAEDELGWFGPTEGWRRVVADLRLIHADIGERHPDLPRVLLGHSMGSFMTLSYLMTHGEDVDLAVLSGSNVGGGLLVKAGRVVAKLERLRQGPRGRSKLLDFLSFGSFNNDFKPARTDFDWLSRDPEEVDRYVADPRCGFIASNQLWVDFLAALIELGEDSNLARIPKQLPIYVLAGERDPVGGQGEGVRALVDQLRATGHDQVDLRLYPEGRHEMFNETNRDEVTAELIAWLNRRLSA